MNTESNVAPKRTISKKKPIDPTKCKVPSLRTSPKSTLWARHVYLIINEFAPQLLEKQEVVDAFHAFVAELEKHDSILETYVPGKRMKYLQGIVYEKLIFKRYMDGSIPGKFKNEDQIWRHPELKETHQRITEEIKQAYLPLYELIKRDVVPLMEKKIHEEEQKRRVPSLRNEINVYLHYLKKEEERHKDAMESIQTMLSHKIEELRVLNEEFPYTKFD
jgi:hypothetical protein